MRILVGSTIPAFKMTDDGDWWHWLENAEQITDQAARADHDVEWLAVLQYDARGDQPFSQLFDRLSELQAAGLSASYWQFSIETHDFEITSSSRLVAICTGRNLIIERGIRRGAGAIYFADADISAPDDVLPKLLELDHPVVGGHVPTYCLDGPPVEIAAGVGRSKPDVREHWNTAGSLLVHREAFRRVPWRHDPDAGCTDDPATQHELAQLGFPTWVRHDVICEHHPSSIVGLEDRGHDLAVYR